jgi:hypothetical protein
MKIGRSLRLLMVLSIALVLTGCGVYVVKKAPPGGGPQGIPFYVKTAGCKREIVRLKPYYLLTLSTKTADKTSEVESTAVCAANATSSAFESVLDAARTGGDITKPWAAMKRMSCDLAAEPANGSNEWHLTSDTISAYTYVDYQTPYTLNVRRPIIGSASATTKLASDGTLTEGTAQMEDKTGAALLGAIPAAALAAREVGIPKPPTAALPYELKIELKGVKFTATYRDPLAHGGCEKDPLLVSDPPNTGKPDLLIEDAGGGDKKAADDGSTVKVSGTVQLPKAKDGDTGK